MSASHNIFVYFFTYVHTGKKIFFYCVLLALPLFLTGAAEDAPAALLFPADERLSAADEELRLRFSAEELPEVFAEFEDCDLLLLEVLCVLLLLLLDDEVAGAEVALAGMEFLYSLSARSSRARALASS